MKPELKNLYRELQYKGLVAGIAPVYVGIFTSDDGDKEYNAGLIVSRPFCGLLLYAVELLWNTVAKVSGKYDYLGAYPIKLTGHNPYYDPVKEDVRVQDE